MNPDTSDPAALASPELPRTAVEADRNGNRLNDENRGEVAEDLSYDVVPPKQTITVSVRYRIRGRGRPLPYPLGEE